VLRTDSPALLDLGIVRRNSLRSLRSLRSDKAPQVGCTKRASRADPEAALLGAAEIAQTARASAARARARPLRPAAACRSAGAEGVRCRRGNGIARRSDRDERAARRNGVDHGAGNGAGSGTGNGAGNGAGSGTGNGAGRPPPACLCAAEKRSGVGPRAQRASFI